LKRAWTLRCNNIYFLYTKKYADKKNGEL
jgi:hypothetical protein